MGVESARQGLLFPVEYREDLTDRVTLFRAPKRRVNTDDRVIGLRNGVGKPCEDLGEECSRWRNQPGQTP